MKSKKRVESSKGKIKKTKRKSKGEGRSPYTTDERMRAVTGFRQSGMTLGEFCQTWGVAEETMKKWLRAFEEGGEASLASFSGAGGRPKGSKKPIPAAMKEAVAEAKEKYPFFGVRRVRSWCERFLGIDVPRRTVEETLAESEKSPEKKRRKTKAKKPLRFERARPMQMWQSDITQYVCPRTEKKVFLCVFLDDCTRYIVGWSVGAAQTAELVMQAYELGVSQYGRPQEALTDQGRQYASWRGKTDFQKKLKLDGVKHILSRPHHPETLGKCERLWKTVREEFWERVEIVSVDDARDRLVHWFGHYNFFRPHQSLDGATPADRFFGVEEKVRKVIAETVEKNAESLALSERPRQPFYVTGQIGNESLAIAADRGGLVVSTGEGTRRLPYEDLGELITRTASPSPEREPTAFADISNPSIESREDETDAAFSEPAPTLQDETDLEIREESADV